MERLLILVASNSRDENACGEVVKIRNAGFSPSDGFLPRMGMTFRALSNALGERTISHRWLVTHLQRVHEMHLGKGS